jgi:predicted Holliday junction resolvase-like endonuclease
MQDLLVPTTLIVFFLLIVALCAISVLVYLYYSLKAKTTIKIQEEIKKVELVAIQQAREQFQQWRIQEFDQLRQQQLEIARSEMIIEIEQWKMDYEQEIRRDAIQRSQSVTVGKITEHIVPFLPDFPYNPKDARFIGSPVDFIVFDGLDAEDVRGVVFVEVKTGTATLSTRERRVRNAVQEGQVSWLEIRPSMELGEAP